MRGMRDNGRRYENGKILVKAQEDGEHDSEEELDENKKRELENFIQNIEDDDNVDGFIGFGMDDDEEANRVIAESKRKREEILKKFNQNNGNEETNKSYNITTQSQEVASQTLLASEGIAAMVIVEEDNTKARKILNHIQNNDDKIQEELERERLAILAEAQETKVTNEFDMFSTSPVDAIPAVYSGKVALKSQLIEGEDPHLQSNWDDGEGYYKTRIGEIICNKYQALGVVGKGVFSTVLKCVDLQKSQALGDTSATAPNDSDATNDSIVAIKLIRNNETMRKAAEKEKSILLESQNIKLQNLFSMYAPKS
jgi:hypothetical protein